MILEIDDKLLQDIKTVLKSRAIRLHKKLDAIEPYTPTLANNRIEIARAIKTKRVKQVIKEEIKKAHSQSIAITKYQINKNTKVSYNTINKYYDELLQEVQNEH